jgi:hypothetical protein
MRLLLAVLFALIAAPVAACHHDSAPAHPKAGDLPPLPPASGTPLGYLIDAQSELKLNDDQLGKLKELDQSLAARDAEIDTQLRQVERPEEEPPTPKGQKRPRHNNAPGASGKPSGDAAKLHAIRDSQDHDALKKAWVILDKDQQGIAAKILGDHDVEVPGQKRLQAPTTDEGTPVPGMEP